MDRWDSVYGDVYSPYSTDFARQVFGRPLMWSEELSSLIFVYVGMLGISMGIRNQTHVLIDFLCSRFSPRMQR